MKLEVKYIFLTSTLGANNYTCKLSEGLGMRQILACGTGIQTNLQTREDIFWIFTDFQSYVGPMSNLHPQIDISSMRSLTMKMSIEFSESWKIILFNFRCFKSFILSASEPV